MSRSDLDLRELGAVEQWFFENRPEFVVNAAGRVGGIDSNSKEPVDYLFDNLMIHTTVFRAAWKFGVEKLLYLGSSCIYPRECPQPIREEYLMTGPLEPTNSAYAIAKIAGVRAGQAYREQYGCNFISAQPTNLYGPGDNYSLFSSHVLPALMRRFHEAKLASLPTVTVWGSGRPRREFLHVDDLARACLFLLERFDGSEPINIGTGEDVTIRELAELVRDIVYPECEIRFDEGKPDGTPRKLLDVSRIHELGWRHETELEDGIRRTYAWFLDNYATLRR